MKVALLVFDTTVMATFVRIEVCVDAFGVDSFAIDDLYQVFDFASLGSQHLTAADSTDRHYILPS
jgi:hypothetical protein